MFSLPGAVAVESIRDSCGITAALAVGLFFLGLCFFASSIHPAIQRTIIPLVVLWVTLLLAATLAPIFSPRCPYKTTFLKNVLKRLRHRYPNLRSSSTKIIEGFVMWLSNWHVCSGRPVQSPATDTSERRWQPLSTPLEEEIVAKSETIDLDTVTEIDSVKANDKLITIALPDLVSRHPLRGEALTSFVFKILRNRGPGDYQYGSHPLDLQHLSRPLWDTITRALADDLYLEFEQRSLLADTVPFASTWDKWIQDTLNVLFSVSEFALNLATSQKISTCFSMLDSSSISLLLNAAHCQHPWSGEYMSTFVLQLLYHLPAIRYVFDDWYPPDLVHLSKQIWDDVTWILVDAVCQYKKRLAEIEGVVLVSANWDLWMKNAFRVIFANSHYRIPDRATRRLYSTFSVDEIRDQLLSSIDSSQANAYGQETTSYVLRILGYRDDEEGRPEYPLDLSYLSSQTWLTVNRLLAAALNRVNDQWDPWTLDAIHLLFSDTRHHRSEDALRAVIHCFHTHTQPSIFFKQLQSQLNSKKELTFTDQISFHLRLLGNTDLHSSLLWRVYPLSNDVWNIMAIALVSDLAEELRNEHPEDALLSVVWIKIAIRILFSDIGHPLPPSAILDFTLLAEDYADKIVGALVGTYEEERTTLVGASSIPFSFTRMLRILNPHTFVYAGTRKIITAIWKLQASPRVIDITLPVLARHADSIGQTIIEVFQDLPLEFQKNRKVFDRVIKFYIQRSLVFPDVTKRLDHLQRLIVDPDEEISTLAIALIVTNMARIRGVYWPGWLQAKVRRSLKETSFILLLTLNHGFPSPYLLI